MIKFTVLVKIYKDEFSYQFGLNLEQILKNKLSPFQSHWNQKGPSKHKPFVKFIDKTEHLKKDAEMLVEPDSDYAHWCKNSVGKTKIEAYGNNMDEFAKDWHHYIKNGDKYGLWDNPNGKFHNYEISQFIGSISKCKDLDVEYLEFCKINKINDFWEKCNKAMKIKSKNRHEWLIRNNLIKKLQDLKIIKFKCDNKNASCPIYDVEIDLFSLEIFTEKFGDYFNWSIPVVLDKNGWHKQCSLDNSAFFNNIDINWKDWKGNFYKNFVSNEDPETLFVFVECSNMN